MQDSRCNRIDCLQWPVFQSEMTKPCFIHGYIVTKKLSRFISINCTISLEKETIHITCIPEWNDDVLFHPMLHSEKKIKSIHIDYLYHLLREEDRTYDSAMSVHLSGWQERTITLDRSNRLIPNLACDNILLKHSTSSKMSFIGPHLLVPPLTISEYFQLTITCIVFKPIYFQSHFNFEDCLRWTTSSVKIYTKE